VAGDITSNIFSPARAKEATWAVISDRIEYPNKGLPTGLTALDNVVLPWRPGQLIGVQGYTSNFKTGLMNNIAYFHANRLRESNSGNEIVVRFDWEMSVEEQGVVELARMSQVDATALMKGEIELEDYDRLKKQADDRERLPLWMVGHSSESNEKRPRMSMKEVAMAMDIIINKFEMKPILVVLDYLQRIRRLHKDIRVGHMEIVDDSKDLAIEVGCPVVLGCQSSRKVKLREWRMPRADDAAETANFEQSCDIGFSTWMPKNDYPVGTTKKWGQKDYEFTANMLLISMWKQKFGPAPWLIETYVKYATYEIFPVTYQASFMSPQEQEEVPF
jgi:replicative DNA helicase